MVPPLPTAVPVFASLRDTPPSALLVPLSCLAQVAPPSVVRTMVEKYPQDQEPVTSALALDATRVRRHSERQHVHRAN